VGQLPLVIRVESMSKSYNDNLRRVKKLTQEMLALADEGDRDRDDDSCGIIYGILRDSVYRLRAPTEKERQRHERLEKWD